MRIITPGAATLLAGCGLAAAAEGWLPGFHLDGVSGEVTDIERSGPYLYVAGDFESIGTVLAPGLARLGANGWEPLGDLPPCRTVSELEVVEGGPVYAACGAKIYSWDGKDWTALQLPEEGTPEKEISAMAVGGRDLYYVRSNGAEVWRRSGDRVEPLEARLKGWVATMEVLGNELVIGGSFTSVGDSATSNIARWTAAGWWGYGAGVRGTVSSVAAFGGSLYAGAHLGLMRWDGKAWHREYIEPDDSNTAYALLADETALYACVAPAREGKALARLQAGGWTLHGAGFLKGMAEIRAFGLHEGSLWFGGRITNPRGAGIEFLGAWDGTSFRPPGPPSLAPAGRVRSLATDGRGGLFAAGAFTIPAGGEGYSLVARRTESGWEAAGPQRGEEIYTLDYPRKVAAGPEGLYLAGAGVTGGTQYTAGVQHFDGQAWKPLTGVLEGASLLAVQPFPGGLYVGGDFMELDTAPARMLARWDGRGWSGLGTGANAAVRALKLSGEDLLAAGDFTAIGGVPARVGRWSNGRWSRLDAAAGTDGLENGAVHALEVWDGMVVAGGDFTVAGGLLAGGVAAWDGVRWKTFGKGFQGKINALAVCQGKLYAGGQFLLTAAGTRVNGIARWNGAAWEPLGQGLYSYRGVAGDSTAQVAHQLLALGSELWVTGYFSAAGGVPSNRLAVWSTGEPPQSIQSGRRMAKERSTGRFLDLVGMPPGADRAGSASFDLGGRRLPDGASGAGWRVLGR